MSESNIVTVPYGDNASNTATLLLAEAEKSDDYSAADIRTGSFGNFYAPRDLAEAAGVDYIDDDAVDAPESGTVTPVLDENEPDRYLVGGGNSETGEAFDPSDHKVEDVLAYIEANPEQREAVIAAERDGKNRVSITESQE